MFSKALQRLQTSTSSEIDQNLQDLKNLLAEKYLHVNVVNVSATPDEIKVILLNGRHGVNDGIDEENKRPIEFLQSFDGKVSKEKAQYEYWSNSVITFPQSKLQNVIDGLKAMPAQKLEHDMGKLMARC